MDCRGDRILDTDRNAPINVVLNILFHQSENHICDHPLTFRIETMRFEVDCRGDRILDTDRNAPINVVF